MNDAVTPAFRFNRPPGPTGGPRVLTQRSQQVQTKPAQPLTDSVKPNGKLVSSFDRAAIIADAERLLHRAKGAESQRFGTVSWMQRAGLNVRKASDAQHLEAVALAYASYVRISTDPMQPSIMAELETLSGRKRSRTTHDLHLIVEQFVSYGGETPAERLAARKLVSRDVRAIQHLESAKVLPSQVQVLAAVPGQGLHAWARQTAVTKKARSGGPTAIAEKRREKNEARQRTLIHEVTITTRRQDGTRKNRQRFRITGVLGSDVAGLKARLKRLGLQALSEA